MRLLGVISDLFFFFVESKQKKTTFLCTLNCLKRRECIGKQKRQHIYMLKMSKKKKTTYSLVCFLCSLKATIRNCLFVCFSCFLKASRKNCLFAFYAFYEWRFVYFLCHLWVKVACLLFNAFWVYTNICIEVACLHFVRFFMRKIFL